MERKHIAVIGAGPSGLLLYKRLVESGRTDITIDIFEAKSEIGKGMPYSTEGANHEHVTNVSGNEIPDLVSPLREWLKTLPKEVLDLYHLNPNNFNDYKVIPRLLFGQYLNAQFSLLMETAAQKGIQTTLHLDSVISDVKDLPGQNRILVEVANGSSYTFNQAVICTGHKWPLTHEGSVRGYYDSPYPPLKLRQHFNHEIALRGSSLTAIDAIRTLSRQHGFYQINASGKTEYQVNQDANNFKIIMHSRDGLLPAIRFHLEDPHLSKNSLLSEKEIKAHINDNGGFLSLDFIFEKDFKNSFYEKDPSFYDFVKDLTIEEFVKTMMDRREHHDPFVLFKMEYAEAQQSIKQKKSVYWKEMLAVLSFAMNYPAKHFSAEDMERLHHVLMPLISIVIAFVPQSSCEEMIALHDAGRLELVAVGRNSKVEVSTEKEGIRYIYEDEQGMHTESAFKTFIDCIGQPHLMFDSFPFKSMVQDGTITPARLKFRSPLHAKKLLEEGNQNIETRNGTSYLRVPGIAIDDNFSIIQDDSIANPRLYMMAVSYMGGFNPDYSGLDFCEEASKIIVDHIFHLS